MGSSSKRSRDKEKESKKRKHHNREEVQVEEIVREKKRKHHHHHHRKHHKDRKREKRHRTGYDSADSDVVEVVPEPVRVPTPPPPEIKRGTSPESSGVYHESLSIEETNKIRAKLGLKPLQTNSTGTSSDDPKKDDGKKKDDLGEFYHRPAASLTSKIQQEKVRSRLSDHKEKRHIDSKLSKVKLLSEVHNEDEDDVTAWVKKSRKIDVAKVEAEKRAKLLEEMDEQFGIGEVIESDQKLKRMKQYNERNLRGLQVNHNIDSFKEGHTVILTLDDKGVLDEDGDVLVNVNMLDNERYQKSNENKKKKHIYSGYDNDEEIDEFGNLKTKSLLSKYDEEIEGEKRESFKIGYDNSTERKQARLQSIKEKLANKLVDSIETRELTIASDYYNEEEMAKFKKRKRQRKMRLKGKLTADDLERAGQPPTMDYDDTLTLPSSTKIEIKMEDENEDSLERALHKARKVRQKESLAFPEIKPEPVDEAADTGNIILNATAEFCRTLGDIPTYGKSGNREDIENLQHLEKEEDDEEDMEIEDPEEIEECGRWNAVDPNRIIKQQPTFPPVVETPILEEEPDLSLGVGAALKLARSKGYLDKEENNRPSNTRLAYLQAQHYSIEDKNYNDDMERSGAASGANRRERFAGPITDFREKDSYKPNVKLEYIDDEGHILNAKEAFRYLSHKFHGKGPGKNKVEKRVKKVVQEGLMKKMSSTDTPLGTLNMLQLKQKEMQSPYIVLSGGKHTHSTTISKARR